MADPRTFVLIGEFKDGITPELAKINNQLAQLTQTFSKIGGKGARTASRDLGKFNAAVEGLSNTLRVQNQVLKSTIEPMRQYRREVGKTIGALKRLDEAGGRSIAIERTNKALAEQIRLMDQLRSRRGRQEIGSGYRRPPRGGGGEGYTRPPRGGGRGGAGMGPGGFHMAEFGFAYTLGNAISQPVTNAIVSGFQIGVGLMVKPFEYFANRLGERMQDELSDLKAAGGFFSMAKRQEQPFVKNFADAIQFTQENNKVMARLAASLPGKTQDYIEVAKRISDSVARTVLNDRAATIQMAEKIRAGDIKTYGAKSITGMAGPEATKKAIQVLLGDLTKDTVLAGMGGRAGAGGAMGAYGLPQLSERMISQDEVSMGQMQRYSAIFSDPMIMDALQRNINKINATSKNSAERLQAIANMYKEIVTPELIERYRRTLAGVAETFNTAIFGEETGLFGLGRKMEGLGVKFNEYGQMIDKFGNVTTKLTEAAREDLAIYDLFRDILVNVGQVLAPIVENLTLIYDPLKQLGIDLNKAREATYEILQSFNYYKKGFEAFSADNLKGQAKELFDSTRDFRASLATIGNLLRHFKVIGEGEFKDLMKQLQDPNVNLGQILQKMVDQFMQSDIAAKIGEFIGTIIGTVLTEVAKITGFLSNRVESSNKLFAGIQAGFTAAGGPEAIKNIFSDVFKTLFKLLVEVLKLMPLEGYLMIAAMAVIPAAIQGVAMAIASGITGGLGMLGGIFQKQLPAQIAQAGARRSRVTGGGLGEGMYKGRPQRYGAGGSIDRLNRMRRARYERAGRAAMANAAYAAEPFVNYAKTSRLGQGAMGVAKGAGRLARRVPGGAMAAGAVDMGIAMASGENFGKAAIGAIGTVLGATAGTVFGPAGTMIGGIAGGMLADASSDFIIGAFDQNHAAKLQMEAAQKQVDAAASAAQQKYGPKFGAQLGGIEALNKSLGGGAGVKAYAAEQLKLGKILPEQAQSWDILGTELTNVNKTTAKVEKAQKAYDNAVKLNTGEQKKYKDMLEKAKGEQEAALSRITTNWESMSAANRTKLLGAADGIVDALNGAAAKIRGWRGIPGLTPPPPPGPTTPKPTTETPIDKKPGPRPLDSRQLIPGLPATPESGYGVAKGHLGDAIRYEMRNKPPGSDLLIANSSETVIPAAGGHGMMDFVETLRWGFGAMMGAFKQAQQKQDSLLTTINQTLKSNQQATDAKLTALGAKFSTPGMTGGLGGGAAGGVDAFTGMAQRFGLTMTSAYRPGDPGWHGANRARDFSNGTGPTPQMLEFAQFLAANYGANLKELIYTPLGFSIKNGQKVAPYAQSSHNNHVHVAYGLGAGNPAFFSSQSAAERWERSMVSGSVRVGSITGNSAEGFGSGANVVNNITINQQPGQDADELASIVAMKISEAVSDARSASIFI